MDNFCLFFESKINYDKLKKQTLLYEVSVNSINLVVHITLNISVFYKIVLSRNYYENNLNNNGVSVFFRLKKYCQLIVNCGELLKPFVMFCRFIIIM